MIKKNILFSALLSVLLSSQTAYADEVIISAFPGEPVAETNAYEGSASSPLIVEPLILPGSVGQEISLNSSLRSSIVSYALQFVGNPYVYGGTSLTEGTDCSGFIMRVFEHFGINTGRDSRSQAAACIPVDINSIRPGDLIFYADGNYINHVALYIGNGKIVHAQGKDSGITVSDAFYKTPYKAGTFSQ